MGFFSAPKVPQYTPPPPPPPPPAPVTVDTSQDDINKAQEAEKKRLQQQRGRAATILSGSQGVLGDDSAGVGGVATKKLLGG